MLLQYLAARLRHWDPFVVRFLNMGLGIENRARTLAPFWAEHLKQTRAAQERWAETARGDLLTVLGAGRLLDFNGPALMPKFAKLRLVDADPLCAAAWRKLQKPVEAVCTDISGCLGTWLKNLKHGHRNWLEMLDSIRRQESAEAYSAECDGVLSLNVLSQLQIVWQDGVEALLKRRFGKAFVDKREEEWLDAVRPGGQKLVERHLAAMGRAEPRFVLIVTDLDYLEYQGRVFERDHWAAPPVEWTKEGWRVEEGITCEVSPALEGVELDEESLTRWLPSYRLAWQDCWLWHIEPLGTEDGQKRGKVHRVGAFALERRR